MGSCGGSVRRDWSEMYAIYGLSDCRMVFILLLSSSATSALLSLFLLLPLHRPLHAAAAGLLCFVLLAAASDVLRSSLPLHWRMCQRVVSAVPDWPSVRRALGLGCGRGLLLTSVALRLRESGSHGRVVGIGRGVVAAALRAAAAEGVGEYVTCREGDCRGRLPFPDGYFDVVVSSEAARLPGAEEAVRVLRGGGRGVLWDVGAEGIARGLREMGMEEVSVSDGIVSFRKPLVDFAEAVVVKIPSIHWSPDLIC